MKKRLLLTVMLLFLTGCARYEEVPVPSTAVETAEKSTQEEVRETKMPEETERSVQPAEKDTRVPKKVKGIYLSAYIAGTPKLMDNILAEIEKSQVNAVVIDVKNDDGRITFPIDTPVAGEIGACKPYISDVDGLIQELKARDIYVIARVVAFRDPFLAEARPEWSLKKADGSLYRDKQGLAWVNPYKKEVWDYLIEVGKAAAEAGFDEVQFDYIRFSTEKGMKQVVFDEEDTKGRSKTDIITEFITYAYEPLKEAGLFVSADVFGAIIGSERDANSVGQIYYEMAKHLDYICPMIYPSHYADGNFGIEHPDTKPYETILAALMGSQADLASSSDAGKEEKLAVVRPWLQDFTASYLEHYITYGPEQVKAQIQAVYDAGYEEWIFWDAACTYEWKGLEKEN